MDKEELKAPPKVFSPNVVIHKKTADSTTFRVLGVPYYGPDSLGLKDLHGEYFSKATDFDMLKDARVPVIDRVISYYDHAYNDNVGKGVIGVAKFVEEKDDGQVWDIEVQRAYRYLDMLETMAMKGLLGASSQPIQSAAKINWETGHIDRWPVGELSLTPTPANPLAVATVMKSFGMEYSPMGDVKDPTLMKNEGGEGQENVEKKPVEPVVPADEKPVEDAPAPQDPETKTNEPVVPTLEDEINDAFKQTPADQENVEVLKTLAALVKGVSDLTAEVASLKGLATDSNEKVKSAVVEINLVKNGMKALALNVAKSVKFELDSETARQLNQPADERSVEETLRKSASNISSFMPDNAPGLKVGS